MSAALGRLGSILLFCLAAGGFWLAAGELRERPMNRTSGEMEVALPWFVQVLMSGGDRYLAADIGTIRALVVSTTKMDAGNYRVLARVQEDASWLNPGHADNYYIATAILPWVGEVDATQRILRNAIKGRPFDSLPPFYYAFNIYFFDKNPTKAAGWLREAAKREEIERNRFALEDMAARWYEKGNEPSVAISLVKAMAEDARDPAFKRFLLQRVDRLRMLESLDQAADRFEHDKGRKLERLDELVSAGYLAALPTDPFGFGFKLDENGRPVLLSRAERKKQQ